MHKLSTTLGFTDVIFKKDENFLLLAFNFFLWYLPCGDYQITSYLSLEGAIEMNGNSTYSASSVGHALKKALVK